MWLLKAASFGDLYEDESGVVREGLPDGIERCVRVASGGHLPAQPQHSVVLGAHQLLLVTPIRGRVHPHPMETGQLPLKQCLS